MVYRKPHLDCSEKNCHSYSAYIRVQKKWIKAGEYNSKCKTFTPEDEVRTYDQVQEEIHNNALAEWYNNLPDSLRKQYEKDFNV